LAYLVMFRLLGRWGATRTSMVAYLLPVFGIGLGVLVAHETVGLPVIAGTLLIVAGVALASSSIGARRLFGRAGPQVEGGDPGR
jgi:drug/metabolite transporter (DMT)-like permease